MSMLIDPYRFGSGPAPSNAFSSSISAVSPQIWLRLNEASGAVATNSGSSGVNGAYNGTLDYHQGPLCGNESLANSVATNAVAESVTCGLSANSNFQGLIGICYKGTGNGNTVVRILWRTVAAATGHSYIRIDQTNITVAFTGTGIGTGVPSSILKDGNAHFIMLGRLSGDTNVYMWIDGSLVWTYALGAGTWSVSTTLVIARNGSNSEYLYGQYGDAFVKSGVVTSLEASAINTAWSTP